MIHYFFDPILKAPTIGAIAMCLACSLVGVLIFIRKESLLGETLSHAAYPGIMLAVCLAFIPKLHLPFSLCVLVGAGSFAYLSLYFLDFCKKKLNMSADSALTFVLTLFFGLGLTLASFFQNTFSRMYKQASVFLFGQAATITDFHMYLSIALLILVLTLLTFYHRQIQIANFDPIFSRTVGISSRAMDNLIYLLMVASIVVGIRSIGLLLLSGMFIAPAIAARQWTHKLNRMFILSGVIGALSGFIGIASSYELSLAFSAKGSSLSFATGPMIILTSSCITFFSLLFAPKQGWISRFLKVFKFKLKCSQENLLKSLWHFTESNSLDGVAPKKVWDYQSIPQIYSLLVTLYLRLKRDIILNQGKIKLSKSGCLKAEKIVRLHRLWEVYLVHIGVGKEKVHHNAEEMEHIITPHIEAKLLKLMKHPTTDPHNQPIPNPTGLEAS